MTPFVASYVLNAILVIFFFQTVTRRLVALTLHSLKYCGFTNQLTIYCYIYFTSCINKYCAVVVLQLIVFKDFLHLCCCDFKLRMTYCCTLLTTYNTNTTVQNKSKQYLEHGKYNLNELIP